MGDLDAEGCQFAGRTRILMQRTVGGRPCRFGRDAVAWRRSRSRCQRRPPTTFALDLDDVHSKITPRTRTVIAVPMWGYPADGPDLADACRRWGLPLIEDAAQAHGTTVGALCAALIAGGSGRGSGDAGACSLCRRGRRAGGEPGPSGVRVPIGVSADPPRAQATVSDAAEGRVAPDTGPVGGYMVAG
jgi:hypothetical protein